MGARTWVAILTGCLGVIPPGTEAIAQPFVLVPRVPTELDAAAGGTLMAPPGWELTAGKASAGACAVVGAAGTGIRGGVVAAAAGPSPIRAQLTLSTFGTFFYQEHRVAGSLTVGGADGVGVVVEGRAVALGSRWRRAVGVGWLLRGRRGPLAFLATARPSARLGEGSLFPEGWLARVALLADGGALGLSATGGVEGNPAMVVTARWIRSPAALDLGLDLASGALTLRVGFRGGPLVGFAGVTHHTGLGTGGVFGVLGGGG